MSLVIALLVVKLVSSDLIVINHVELDALLVIKQQDIAQLVHLDSSKHQYVHHALIIVLQEQSAIHPLVIAQVVLMDGKVLSVLFHVKLDVLVVIKLLEYVLLALLGSMDHQLVNIVAPIVLSELLVM